MMLVLSILSGSVLAFCLMVGDFTWQNLLVGTVLSGLLLWVFRKYALPNPMPPNGQVIHILLYAPVLLYYLFFDILKGTWQVVSVTTGIRPLHKPGIIKYPIPTRSSYGVGPVAYFITLSPGSFLVDIDWEENVMLVHVLDASDPDALRRDAEKYYRLWEYESGSVLEHEPISLDMEEDDRE